MRKCSVAIVAGSLPAVRAAIAAAPQTPVVTSFIDDPVADGLVRGDGIRAIARAVDVSPGTVINVRDAQHAPAG